MKPTRTFTICTAPIICADDHKFEVIEPPLLHEVKAVEIKHIAAPGEGWFHLVDVHGTIVFSSPSQLVRWCKMEPVGGHLTLVPPITEQEDV